MGSLSSPARRRFLLTSVAWPSSSSTSRTVSGPDLGVRRQLPVSRSGRRREREEGGGAAARRRGGPDPAAVAFDDAAYDGETHSLASPAAPVHVLEDLENLRPVLGRNTDPVVADGEHRRVVAGG